MLKNPADHYRETDYDKKMAKLPTGLSTWQMLRFLWHLPNFGKLYWRLFKDRRVPLRAKAVLIAAVVYILSPIDLLPEMLIPFFGAVDDVAVFFLASRWFISLCPTDVVEEQVKEISGRNEAGRYSGAEH